MIDELWFKLRRPSHGGRSGKQKRRS
jgi:hypothetical protein